MSSPIEPLYRPAVIKRLLESYGLAPKKAWGQNFLADGNTVSRIVQAVDVRPGETVIEIGPGLGALTQGLLQAGASVIAIEKDRGLAAVLQDLFADQPLTVVVGDALQIQLADLVQDSRPCKVAANLPYYITSPLLMHILESGLPFERIVVMVQKEVAERLVARPGTEAYGALTVAVQYRAEPKMIGTVSPNVFFPPPTVQSEIVLLTPHEKRLDVGDEATFNQVVKAAFGQRRKTIKNALSTLKLPPGRIEQVLNDLGIDPRRRGETFSIQEFSLISLSLSQR